MFYSPGRRLHWAVHTAEDKLTVDQSPGPKSLHIDCICSASITDGSLESLHERKYITSTLYIQML